jgi:(p)ppGpp synthase/HD superfamily hydrolase
MHIDIDIDTDIDEVIAFATERHAGQKRADGSDYVNQPIRVSNIVAEYKPSKNELVLQAGAILHDVLEDTYTSYRELRDKFGEVVASLVMEVTSSTYVPKLVGKQIYLAHKMRYMSSYALIIKLADRLDNLSDISSLPEEKLKKTFFDSIYMVNYIENKRILTEPQSNLVNAIREKLNKINNLHHFANKNVVQYTDIDQD